MNLLIQALHPEARVPRYATAGAAGFDLHAVSDGSAVPGAPTKVPLGLAVAVPEGFAMLITARSGHGAKFGAGVPHGYGLIDSDYRGELFMVFRVDSVMRWKKGDRIAQACIVPVQHVRFDIVQQLPGTERGVGGFGSTGS